MRLTLTHHKLRQNGGEGARHVQRPYKVHLKLLSRGLDRPIGEKAARPCDASIIDEQIDVAGDSCRGESVFVTGLCS